MIWKRVNDKRQITATFTFAVSDFLPIKLICNGKNKRRCLPKYHFTNCFEANHWFKFEKLANLFENIIFPFLKAKREEFGYPKQQYSLIVMETFTCQKDDCQLVHESVAENVWLKHLHGHRVLEMNDCLKQQKGLILNEFDKAGKQRLSSLQTYWSIKNSLN